MTFNLWCFQVHSYALLKDVVGALKRPNMEARQFKHHPLLVMNGFSGDGMHLKLMTTMFQNLFPSINVNTVSTQHHRPILYAIFAIIYGTNACGHINTVKL